LILILIAPLLICCAIAQTCCWKTCSKYISWFEVFCIWSKRKSMD